MALWACRRDARERDSRKRVLVYSFTSCGAALMVFHQLVGVPGWDAVERNLAGIA